MNKVLFNGKLTSQNSTNSLLSDLIIKNNLPLYDISEGSANRGEDNNQNVEIDEETLVYIEFEDGSHLLLSPEEAKIVSDRYKEQRAMNRGGLSPKEQAEKTLLIPTTYGEPNGNRGGIRTWVAKLMTFIKTDIFKDTAVKMSMREAGIWLDKRQCGKQGLYTIKSNFQLDSFVEQASHRYFLLIHGTASNTTGAFYKNKEEAGRVVQQLRAQYGEGLICFNHYTVSKSPFQNLKLLTAALPEKCELEIMSHSRGGLITDLLQLALLCKNNDVIKNDVIRLLEREAAADDYRYFEEALQNISVKNININKTIRVGCPGAGTTLLSDNLPNFLRTLSLLFQMKFPPSAKVLQTITEFTTKAIATKDDVDVLPGLQAMTPESELTQLLQHFYRRDYDSAPIGKDYVIAGQSTLRGSFVHAFFYITSWIAIMDRSDMVVNTSSMSKGLKTKTGYGQVLKGDKIHHLNYFTNQNSVELILAAIDDNTSVFNTLDSEVRQQRGLGLEYGNIAPKDITYDRPVIVLLPGMMASSLRMPKTVGKKGRIWVDYGGMLKGDLKLLGHKDLEVEGILDTAYGGFVDFLGQNGYDVMVFPYDWRASHDSQSHLLAAELKKVLKRKPDLNIKFVTHSKGGLVMRRLAMNEPDLYKQLYQHDTFRWIMLGTPWNGSYNAIQSLMGESKTVKNLCTLSWFGAKRKTLMSVFSQIRGIYELLPTNGSDALGLKATDIALWKTLEKHSKPDSWQLPSLQMLADVEAKFVQNETWSIPNIDQVYYIAGRDKKGTLSDINLDEKNLFDITQEGDGVVPWELGIPPELKASDKRSIYFVDTTHNKLLADKKTFRSILYLINTGATNLEYDKDRFLENGSRGQSNMPASSSPLIPLRLPSQSQIENDFVDFGHEEEQHFRHDKIKVSLTHGDLRYASDVLLIGHFDGELIKHAEERLDNLLGNALSQRMDMGIYPTRLGESFFVHKGIHNSPKGAIVVGLGDQYSLTGFQLSQSIAHGIFNTIVDNSQNNITKKSITRLSTLLIGTAYGDISVSNSIKSIVNAIEIVNQKIETNEKINGGKKIDHLEIIEIYEDKMLACFYVLENLKDNQYIEFDGSISKETGKRSSLSITYGRDRWNVLSVRRTFHQHIEKGRLIANSPILSFALSNGKARESQEDNFIPIRRIKHYLDQVLRQSDQESYWDQELSKVLFEMLIPRPLKAIIRMQNNLVLNLDQEAAQYPWELIQDTSITDKPICITAGMIRRLSKKDTRENPILSKNNMLLLVGDPVLDYGGTNVPDDKRLKQLPGAKAEANHVQAVFERASVDVKPHIPGYDAEIYQDFMSNDYRYIHFAAHGVFDIKDRTKSGIVTGILPDGTPSLITAAAIQSKDIVPEFVFINTCYSGRGVHFDDTAHFAANVGAALINAGVKAVVVAGWPVNDQMAQLFAKEFYEKMLTGISFGVAVLHARTACYNARPDNNTWGAYQCYGDPLYQFAMAIKKTLKTEKIYRLEEEVHNDLINLLSKIEYGKGRFGKYRASLHTISTAIEELGIKNAMTLEMEAKCYDHLGRPGIAHLKYEKLIRGRDMSYSAYAISHYQLSKVKKYLSDETDFSKNNNLGQYKKVIKSVEDSLTLATEIGQSISNFCLLARFFKRKAMLLMLQDEVLIKSKETPDWQLQLQINEAITNCIKAYDKAQKISDKTEPSSIHYAGYVRAQLQCVHDNRRNKFTLPDNGGVMNPINKYYNKIIQFNHYLTIYLLDLALPDRIETPSGEIQNGNDQPLKALTGLFDSIWNLCGSYRNLLDEIDHTKFLLQIINRNVDDENGPKNNSALDKRIKVLEHLIEHMETLQHIE